MQLNRLLLIFITYLSMFYQASAKELQSEELITLVEYLKQIKEQQAPRQSNGYSYDVRRVADAQAKLRLRDKSDETTEQIFNIILDTIQDYYHDLKVMNEMRDIISQVREITWLPYDLYQFMSKPALEVRLWEAFVRQSVRFYQLKKKKKTKSSLRGQRDTQYKKSIDVELLQVEANLLTILRGMSELVNYGSSNLTFMYIQVCNGSTSSLEMDAKLEMMKNLTYMGSFFKLDDKKAVSQIENIINRFFGPYFEKLENVFLATDFQVLHMVIPLEDPIAFNPTSQSTRSWWDIFFELSIKFHQLEMKRDRFQLQLTKEQTQQIEKKLHSLKSELVMVLRHVSESFNSGYSFHITEIYEQIGKSEIFLTKESREHVLKKISGIMSGIEDMSSDWLSWTIEDIVNHLFEPHFNDMTQTIIEKYRTVPEKIKYLNPTRSRRTRH